jgi:tetratricopeptide (TPR) repeat protein
MRFDMNDPLRAYILRQFAKRAVKAHRWDVASKFHASLRRTGAARPSDGVRHAKAVETMGRKEEAEQLHRENAVNFPLDPNIHRQNGLFLLRHQKETQAIQAFARALALAPDNEVLKTDLKRLGVDEDVFVPLAVSAFYGSPPPRPARPGPVAKLLARRAARRAKVLRQSGDWPAALAAQAVLLKHNPHSASAQIRLGHILKALGRPREAETAYWRGVALAPRDAESYLQLAHGLKLARSLNDAAPAFLLTQKLHPGHQEAGVAVQECGLSESEGADWTERLASGDISAILKVGRGAETNACRDRSNEHHTRPKRPDSKAVDVLAVAIAGDIARAVGASL